MKTREEIVEENIAKKFNRQKCPRCGKSVLVMKNEFKQYISEVTEKYYGICNGCITQEEREEILFYHLKAKHRYEAKQKLKVIK